MKNISKLLVVLALSAFASSAFAATPTDISGTTSIGGLGFTPSNKVTVRVISTNLAYAAGATHSSGSRTFATNSVASIIYWKDTIDTAVPANATDTFTTGWTSM